VTNVFVRTVTCWVQNVKENYDGSWDCSGGNLVWRGVAEKKDRRRRQPELAEPQQPQVLLQFGCFCADRLTTPETRRVLTCLAAELAGWDITIENLQAGRRGISTIASVDFQGARLVSFESADGIDALGRGGGYGRS